MQNTIPRPAPALRPFPGAPEGLPASLEPLRQAWEDARTALRDARAIYEAGSAYGDDFLAALLDACCALHDRVTADGAPFPWRRTPDATPAAEG